MYEIIHFFSKIDVSSTPLHFLVMLAYLQFLQDLWQALSRDGVLHFGMLQDHWETEQFVTAVCSTVLAHQASKQA